MCHAWLRARDEFAGEDAVKAAGEKYLPRCGVHAHRARASFFNATARTADGYLGLIFRRIPFHKLPDGGNALGRALKEFAQDADLVGTTLASYAKKITAEVIAVGRVGTLIDWEAETENRAFVSTYAAESILNWRMERIKGRNVPTLIVLHEIANAAATAEDEFETTGGEQIRVLKLVRDGNRKTHCVVELWRPEAQPRGQRVRSR